MVPSSNLLYVLTLDPRTRQRTLFSYPMFIVVMYNFRFESVAMFIRKLPSASAGGIFVSKLTFVCLSILQLSSHL
jgi:hypothetical protein